MKTSMIALLLALCAAPAAHAAVVSFDGLIGPTSVFGPAYSEGGLTFTSNVPDADALFHWGPSQAHNADPGGSTLALNVVDEFLTITRSNGDLFDLLSIDLANLFFTDTGGAIPFAATANGITTNGILVLDDLRGLQTFTFNLTGLSSFSLQQVEPFFQLDNIRYESSVPEPGTASLMLLGFGLVAGRRRRTG